jgi:hypothetical protein
MTEAEWLACADPQKMLDFLRGKTNERKLRLFACACCRRLGNLLSDKYSRKALTIAERYADGEVSGEKLGFAWGDARRAAQVAHRQERETAEASAMWGVAGLCEADIGRVVGVVQLAAICEVYPEQHRVTDAHRGQLLLLRDIFGNPFRSSPVIDNNVLVWNDGAVRRLAQAAYDERELPAGTLNPGRLAVLADALEEAGATDAELLQHLRQKGPHVRGCFAIDAALGMS